MADVLVLGCGLIGTSVALALAQAGRDVVLQDQDTDCIALAGERGAGRAWDGRETAAIVLAAVPPQATAQVLAEAQQLGLAQTYTHVSSVQSLVQAHLEALSCDLSQIVGGHPLAGRETSGPAAADAGLFIGRPWALCPSRESSQAAVTAVRELAVACGAEPVEVDIQRHDASVALLSHLPQLASTALASLLAAGGGGPAPDVHFELSGPGLVDTTRLAAGEPELWTQILAANAAHIAPEVRALAGVLERTAGELDTLAGDPGDATARAALRALLEQGRSGRAAVPLKRGRAEVEFAGVSVEVDDQPGRLAALLTAAGDVGINVEDVHVEHVPGRPWGVIQLLVRAGVAGDLSTHLLAGGWRVQVASNP